MIRQPMLAAKSTDADLRRLKYPVLVSPKIDGIRGVVVNGQLLSRSMKPIRNTHTQRLFGRPEFDGLDGELVVGNPYDSNLMQQTSSGVMSISGAPTVRFFVFDMWNSSEAYGKRYFKLWCDQGRGDFKGTGIEVLAHVRVDSYEELLEFESIYVSQGYEGMMIRSFDGAYKDGRSTLREGGLIKVKRFTDDEAVIIHCEPLMRNGNDLTFDERGYSKRSSATAGKVEDDLLGAFYVAGVDSTIRFHIGTGFTESQRRDFWNRRDDLKGKIVKFKHFATTGVKDAPRHPVFLGFRDPEDM